MDISEYQSFFLLGEKYYFSFNKRKYMLCELLRKPLILH